MFSLSFGGHQCLTCYELRFFQRSWSVASSDFTHWNWPGSQKLIEAELSWCLQILRFWTHDQALWFRTPRRAEMPSRTRDQPPVLEGHGRLGWRCTRYIEIREIQKRWSLPADLLRVFLWCDLYGFIMIHHISCSQGQMLGEFLFESVWTAFCSTSSGRQICFSI